MLYVFITFIVYMFIGLVYVAVMINKDENVRYLVFYKGLGSAVVMYFLFSLMFPLTLIPKKWFDKIWPKPKDL